MELVAADGGDGEEVKRDENGMEVMDDDDDDDDEHGGKDVMKDRVGGCGQVSPSDTTIPSFRFCSPKSKNRGSQVGVGA